MDDDGTFKTFLICATVVLVVLFVSFAGCEKFRDDHNYRMQQLEYEYERENAQKPDTEK